MKKLLLLAAVSVIGLTASAQTEKGKIVLGGGVFYSHTKDDPAYSSVNAFRISPNAGYFVADNLAVGLGVGYFNAKYVQDINVGSDAGYKYIQKERHISIAPFVRYYKSVNDQFKFFGNLAVPFDFGKNKYSPTNNVGNFSTVKNHSVGIAFSPGFAYFPTPKLGIEFSVVGLTYDDVSVKYGNTENTDYHGKRFNVGANLASPTIGIQFYL